MDRSTGRRLGTDLRDRGAERASEAADPEVVERIDWEILRLANGTKAFTTDDVRVKIDPITFDLYPNLIGARVLSAMSQGWIAACGFTSSSRPTRHGAIIRKWIGTRKAGEAMIRKTLGG